MLPPGKRSARMYYRSLNANVSRTFLLVVYTFHIKFYFSEKRQRKSTRNLSKTCHWKLNFVIWSYSTLALRHARHFGRWTRQRVSTQGKWAHKHTGHVGTWARKHVRHVGTWARKHVRHVGTWGRKHAGHVSTWARKHARHIATWALKHVSTLAREHVSHAI